MTPAAASPDRWQDHPHPRLGRLARAWLGQPGALTVALRRLGELRLFVHRETVLALTPSWAAEAGLAPGTAVWWREIYMSIDGQPCVQACSFTPWLASQGPWKAMRGLGHRPLADILYEDPRIHRSRFRFGRLRVRRVNDWVEVAPGACVEARHSVFRRHEQPLLVAEYFLPAFWRIVNRPGAIAPRRRFPRFECGWPAPHS